MGTLAAGIKDIFSTAKTTGTNVMLCGNDGTPDGHITFNNLIKESIPDLAKIGCGLGICNSNGGTAAKVVVLSDYVLKQNNMVAVLFAQGFYFVSSYTLNINGTGAKNVYFRNNTISGIRIEEGDIALFTYNGSQYELLSVYSTRALDIPIPFASEGVKKIVVDNFGGVTGGSTNIPGIRGEITYRQALAVTNLGSYFVDTNVGGTFNEFVYFRNCNAANIKGSGIESIRLPESYTNVGTYQMSINGYIEMPATVTAIGRTWWGISTSSGNNCVAKIYATTPPTISYSVNHNPVPTKIFVPQASLTAYQQDSEWSQFGDIFEGF